MNVVHTVVCQISKDIPVYELKPERGKGRSRTLHRNLLLPCDHLPLETSLQPPPKARTAARPDETPDTHSAEEDDDEDEYYAVPCHLNTRSESPLPEGTTEPAHQEVTQSGEVLQETELEVAEFDQPSEDDIDQVDDQPVEQRSPSSHPNLSPACSDLGATVDQRPRRALRKRKVFTYDRLGTPTCYNIQTLPYCPEQMIPWVYGVYHHGFQVC